MLAASLLSLLALVAQVQSTRTAVHIVRVELSGPLDSLVLLTDRGQVRYDHPLSSQEALSVLLPVPAEEARAALQARVSLMGPRDEGGLAMGRARVTAVLPQHPALDELPAQLRARALPVPASGALSIAGATLAALGAVLVWVLRARARAAALVAILATLGVVLVRRDRVAPTIEVLEADARSAVWLARQVSARALPLPPFEQAWSAYTVPASVPLAIEAQGDPAQALLTLLDGLVVVESPWVAPGDLLRAERNDFESLETVYTRQDGVWKAHGPWLRGTALPPAQRIEAPPGWLAAGLPVEGEVWLGRRTSERAESWLRYLR